MILVIDKSAKNAMTISGMFRYMGYISYHSIPSAALREVNNRYRAIIICNPERIIGCDSLVKSLREFSLSSPVFAISDNYIELKKDTYYSSIFDDIYKERTYSSTVVSAIKKYQTEHDLPIIGEYRLAGIDASATIKIPHLCDTPLNFTKTELSILRYLIRTYPLRAKAKDIIKHCFNPMKYPDISNVRTQISFMNKKFKEIAGRPWIDSEMREGYRIVTPVAMANLLPKIMI